MRRTHCEQGDALETAYMQTTLRWINAETRKRMAVPASMGVKVELWHEIARRATKARNDHEEALGTYIDHVATCPVCYPANPAPAPPGDFPTASDASALPEIASLVRHRGSQ